MTFRHQTISAAAIHRHIGGKLKISVPLSNIIPATVIGLSISCQVKLIMKLTAHSYRNAANQIYLIFPWLEGAERPFPIIVKRQTDTDNATASRPGTEKQPMELGLRACWSTPIISKDGRVIGTFAFYFKQCRPPSRWHRRIVDACVHLSALAIERKEARAQIAQLAYFDTLTGLPNRAPIRELISLAIESCSTSGTKMALAFLEVDNFKDVNDTLGHAVDDQLLVKLSERLEMLIQAPDRLGRLGGDEFVIVLLNLGYSYASELASNIAECLAAPLQIGSRQLSVSISIGISFYPDNASDVDTLVQHADGHVYGQTRGPLYPSLLLCDMDGAAKQRMRLWLKVSKPAVSTRS